MVFLLPLSVKSGASSDHSGKNPFLLAYIYPRLIANLNAFRFPDMFDNVGVAKSAGVAAALLVGVSLLPTMLLQWRGQAWRRTGKVVVGAV